MNVCRSLRESAVVSDAPLLLTGNRRQVSLSAKREVTRTGGVVVVCWQAPSFEIRWGLQIENLCLFQSVRNELDRGPSAAVSGFLGGIGCALKRYTS